MSEEGEGVGSGLGTRLRGGRDHIATTLRAHFSFASLLLVLFLTFLDNTIASAVLTGVQSELHAGVTELQWVVGGYALAFASLMLMAGSLGDTFGRKRVMLFGVVIFCAGSIVSAVAPDTTTLIVGRVIMGVGAAGSEPSTLSMIRHIYPNRRARARALGVWAAVSGMALALGPVIGGVLVGLWTWRAVFWFNLVFGVIAFVVSSVSLEESVNEERRTIDAAGFALSTVALALATFATIRGETWGYRSSGVITMYVIAGVSLLTYFVVEGRVRHPMLQVAWVKNRAFLGSTVIAFTSYFSIFSIFFFVALYLEVVASVSAYTLALDFLPLLGGMVVASLVTGRWVSRVGTRSPLVLGCFLAAAGVLLTNIVLSPTVGLDPLGYTMGLAGIGFGIVVVPINQTALTAIPATHSGIAASTINTSRELGAVTGVAILGSLVNGQLTVDLTQRLIQLGIPSAYRQLVINAVITGSVNSQAAAQEKISSGAVKKLISEVVRAAYGAFSHGLDLALTAAGLLMLVSAVIADWTGSSDRRPLVEIDP